MSESAAAQVDIIVPVFRGERAVRRCLDALLASDAMQSANVILVDDASPEPAISTYLRQLAEMPGVTLIAHETNQGFVDSVNEAAAVHPDRDFVILNADTEVASDWLQRLQSHALRDSTVATITPFSNNATIASYPKMIAENELPDGTDTATLHARFSLLNDTESVDIPTAVGFCMWVRRAAWQAAGGFDSIFGRGYGEEVDLCCRLASDGWRHILATDVFVFHQGGVSFGAEAVERRRVAQEIVDQRFPDYAEAVQAWIREDPAMPYRLAVDLERLNQRTGPRWLFVSHHYGGGVQQHIDDLVALIRDELDGTVWLLQPRDDRSVGLRWLGEKSDLEIPIAHDGLLEACALFAAHFGIQRLHFHHFIGLPDSVLELPTRLGLPFDVTFHDFHTVCPQTHFITRDGRFCGRPNEAGCETCVAERPNPWGLGIADWRALYGHWLGTADRLIYPAASVRDIIADYFPALSGEVWPHPERSLDNFQGHVDRSLSRRKFVLIGSLSDVKGLHRLKGIAARALELPEPVEFVVLGSLLSPLGPDAPRNILVTGQYQQGDLADLLARERPDGVLFLSVVPETYNFALSAALATNLPIIALNAGAIGERLRGVAGVTVLPLEASNQVILDALQQSASVYRANTGTAVRKSPVPSPEAYVKALGVPLGGAGNPETDSACQSDLLVSLRKKAPALHPREIGVAKLLEQALDCRLDEAITQLREQAMQNERQLIERNAHIRAADEEVRHLKDTIAALQLASETESNHLKDTIAAVQLAAETESNHLKDTIAAVQLAARTEVNALKEIIATLKETNAADVRAQEGVIDEMQERLSERETLAVSLQDHVSELKTKASDPVIADLWEEIADMANRLQSREAELADLLKTHMSQSEHLAEREQLIIVLADQLKTVETSTFWRMTAPARSSVIWMRRGFARFRRRYKWLKRLPVFIRYHYGMGGWRAVAQAIDRRLQWRTKQSAPGLESGAAIADYSTASDQPIRLSSHARPLVSVVIPTYGQHEVTRRCLASLVTEMEEIACEVILIDDAFVEPFSPEALGVSGLRLIRNDQNLGFLRSCNKAVAAAKGDFVLLLNNDTVVHSGAISALLASFDEFDNVGAVCAQLRFEDGSLQEAGGIVWRDGSAWNWGRGEDPTDPRFSYPREVDYGSAAALMVARSLWRDIGGFDETFVPAYYEDTDFCFAVRAAGQRVIYQPRAVVTHFEGLSHGTDTGSGMKAHQVTNQAHFAEKWGERLAQHRANGVEPMLERDRNAAARVLWVEACMLTPDQDSGSLRTLRLLRILVQMGCKVTYIADNLDGAEPYRTQLSNEGVEVIHSPHFTSVESFLRRHGSEFDVVTLCRHYIAVHHVDTVREVNPRAQIWFDTIDLHYLRLRRQFELDGKKSTRNQAELAYREEHELIRKSDLTIVVSEVERAELAREVPEAKCQLISNVHDVIEIKSGFEARSGVMFVGGFQHPPNIDAVEFYANEIWPLVGAACPDAKTFIIGSRMPDKFRRWGESKGLVMVGFAEDLTPYYQRCRLAIAPLRYGAGVKGKVNQAMSYGLPLVGTPVSVEGMGLVDQQQVMVAESPEDFASAMTEVYTNPDLWSLLSRNGRASLEGRFTSAVAEVALRKALAGVSSGVSEGLIDTKNL